MSIAVMKQALEALGIEREWQDGPVPHLDAAIAALRAAIEQYDQTSLELCKECGWRAMIPGDGCLVCARQNAKPVAWRWKALVNGEFVSNWVLTHSEPPPYATESMPLYTAPRQWVGLTDEEVNEFYWISASTLEAIEAKLKEKNI
jgi:hypothetical protein